MKINIIVVLLFDNNWNKVIVSRDRFCAGKKKSLMNLIYSNADSNFSSHDWTLASSPSAAW